MTATITIQNADKKILNALKSVIELYPQARASIDSRESYYSDKDIQEMEKQAKLYEEGKATLITKTFEELGISV